LLHIPSSFLSEGELGPSDRITVEYPPELVPAKFSSVTLKNIALKAEGKGEKANYVVNKTRRAALSIYPATCSSVDAAYTSLAV